jgi:hypothetical protein
MGRTEEGRRRERWFRVDVWDACCGEAIRIDAEECAEARVLGLETRDFVLAYLRPVRVFWVSVCRLRLWACGRRGIPTSS